MDSSSNRFDHMESLLRGICGWYVRLTIFPPSCAHCLEILGTSTAWSTKSLSRLCLLRLKDLVRFRDILNAKNALQLFPFLRSISNYSRPDLHTFVLLYLFLVTLITVYVTARTIITLITVYVTARTMVTLITVYVTARTMVTLITVYVTARTMVTLITVYVTARTELCCVSYTYHAVFDSAYGKEIPTFALNYGRRHLYYCLLETNRKISFLIITWIWKVRSSV